jgi:uncharacterized membrane protein
MKHKVKSFEELHSTREKISDINEEHEGGLSKLDKVAVWITERVGTMGFFIVIFTWTMLWLSWNTFAPQELRFDPFPAFVLWLFMSNMIQIFLMPLLMIGQNLQSKHSEIRAESHYDFSVKTEEEIDIIIKHLENHNELLEKIYKAQKNKE